MCTTEVGARNLHRCFVVSKHTRNWTPNLAVLPGSVWSCSLALPRCKHAWSCCSEGQDLILKLATA